MCVRDDGISREREDDDWRDRINAVALCTEER